MNYGKIGEGVVSLVIFLIIISSIGSVALVYCVGHFLGLWP